MTSIPQHDETPHDIEARPGTAEPAGTIDFYISPEGNDEWPGRAAEPAGSDGPLASLKGARNAIRRLREQETPRQPIRVHIASGNYLMSETLVLEAQDGGLADAPISFEGDAANKPVFSGGRIIEGWETLEDGLWRTHLPEVQNGGWYFEQLWVNGRRAVRSRLPHRGYFFAAGKVDASEAGIAADPTGMDPATLEMRAFRAKPEDIAPLLACTLEQLRQVTLVAYHSWTTSRHHVAAVDAETSTIYLTGAAEWPFFSWLDKQRFHIENLPGAPEEPGEWLLQADGTLLYRPLPGESIDTANVIGPVLDQFVRITGSKELFVSHLTFRNLSFQHSQYILPYQGHSDEQAEWRLPGVIMADSAQHIYIDNCEIAHTGTHAVYFRLGCSDCSLTHSYLHDLGGGGVYIGETIINQLEADWTAKITVDNNIIHDAGHIHCGAHGVWIGHAGDNTITHNDIGDMLYTAIAVGWHWGYGESAAKRNEIGFNHLHHLGYAVLSDMGGVYTLGPSEGTRVHHNHIHHVDAYGYGGWGLYTDEGSSHILLDNNLVHDTKDGGFHQHFGKENIVRNNIFAFGRRHQLVRTRVEDHLSFTVENNIVYGNGTPVLTGDWLERATLRNNLYWEPNGEVRFPDETAFEAWQEKGLDTGSVISDPLFTDPLNRDFSLGDASPARAMGFDSFDVSGAGVYGDAAWTELAKTAPLPRVEVPEVFVESGA